MPESESTVESSEAVTEPGQVASQDEADENPDQEISSKTSGLKLVVDNTRSTQESNPVEASPGLWLVVDNATTSLADSLPEREQDPWEVTLPPAPEPGVISPEVASAQSAGVGPATPVQREPASLVVDKRLKALMAQRDPSIKRVKRLEVVGDTLHVSFWFKHEAAEGPGAGWLADARFLYPLVN